MGGIVLLALIFVGVVPQFASYSGAWIHIRHLGVWWWVAIAVAAALTQISAVWPYQAALPGLRIRDGFLQIETTSAIASTVPAGGAVAIGMTYKMFSSFGFSDVFISTAVVATGAWSLAAKLGLPVVAVGLLATTAHPTREIIGTAVAGAAAMIIAWVGLWLVFRSEEAALRLGHLADGIVNWVLRFFHKPAMNRVEHALLHFRNQTVETVHRRGWLLTWSVLASQLAVLILVLIIIRAVGITPSQITLAAALTAFAVARLVGAIPITPGGLGTVDATFLGMLTAFGAHAPQALAADLVWRLTTYFLPIFVGIVTYVIWLRRERRSATAPVSDPASRVGGDLAASMPMDEAAGPIGSA